MSAFGMTEQIYTTIPDTSDRNYWQALPYDPTDRSRSYAPRDPELHRRLKAEAWQDKQSKRVSQKRHRDLRYKVSPTGTLPANKH